MIRTILLCATLASWFVVTPVTAGEGLVFPSILPFNGAGGSTLDAGDLNGDGHADIVVTVNVALAADDVLIMLGDGLGDYVAQPLFTVGHSVRRLRLRDVNGDGLLDMLLAVDGAGLKLIATYFGVGDGTFSGSTFVALSAAPNDIDLADMNGDGALDLVVPMLFSNRVAVALGNGNGAYGPVTEFLAGPTPRLSAVGDVNGDGDLDVVVSNRSPGGLSLLLGDGSGGLVPLSSIIVPGSPEDVEMGDFDGDGDLDLAVGHFSHSEVSVLLGNGDGSFGATKAVAFPGDTRSLAVADLDEDGLDDLAALSTSQSAVAVELSNGDGSFGAAAQYSAPGAAEVIAADVTEDGDIDLVANGQVFFLATTVFVMEARGDGSFGHHYRGNDGCSDVQFGDLNGDGVDDMVLANEFSDDLTVYPGTGNGFFGGGVNHPVGDRPWSVALADYDGDGQLDVAVAQGSVTDTLTLLFGDGALGFAPPVVSTVGNTLRTAKALDVDLDGDTDLLVTSRNDNTLLVLRNDGAGSFAAPEVYATTSFPFDLALGDMNGDGLTDAVVSASGGVCHVFLALGGGVFNSALSFVVGTTGEGLALGDVDGDGDLDVAQTDPGGVTVAYNTGGGLLLNAAAFNTGGASCDGVVISDFDRDGLADMAVTNSSSFSYPGADSVGFLKGDGAGNFAPGVESYLSNFPRRLTGHDVNGDGALDLGVPGFGDRVVVLINRRGPWTPLGSALAGERGLPKQVGEGTLEAGDPFVFTLTDGRPNAVTAHILGLTAVNAPFKGGLFVPAPDLINTPLMTDGEGTAVVAGNWFSGLSGFTFYLQFWHADPAGIKGFAASTALRADVP